MVRAERSLWMSGAYLAIRMAPGGSKTGSRRYAEHYQYTADTPYMGRAAIGPSHGVLNPSRRVKIRKAPIQPHLSM